MKILMETKNPRKIEYAINNNIEADFYISSEAGITNLYGEWIDINKELEKGKGGISFLTKNEVSRIDLTRNAFIMALTSYINEDIWK